MRSIRSPQGSSPHTRGAPKIQSSRQVRTGIIPAYAGSTQPSNPRRAGTGDHPRIRGEHYDWTSLSCFCAGSSPHTRGALSLAHRVDCGGGIIPAYAGSTLSATCGEGLFWDHPRIRGEHKRPWELLTLTEGSSPHTRGAQEARRQDARRGGIIPAYAGSTSRAVES